MAAIPPFENRRIRSKEVTCTGCRETHKSEVKRRQRLPLRYDADPISSSRQRCSKAFSWYMGMRPTAVAQ
jgi:hypothetical protein